MKEIGISILIYSIKKALNRAFVFLIKLLDLYKIQLLHQDQI